MDAQKRLHESGQFLWNNCIHCGIHHTVLNTTDGIFVWGSDYYGQLGLGNRINRNTPTKLEFNHEILSVHCGGDHTVLNTTDGIFVCGSNYYGQLGLGDKIHRNVPTKLDFHHEVLSINGNDCQFNLRSKKIKSAATML